MKLLYLGTGLDSAQGVVGDAELTRWEPPDIETPYWELHFDGNISIYTDGRIIMIVKDEEVKKEKNGEKVVRMKRTE